MNTPIRVMLFRVSEGVKWTLPIHFTPPISQILFIVLWLFLLTYFPHSALPPESVEDQPGAQEGPYPGEAARDQRNPREIWHKELPKAAHLAQHRDQGQGYQ